MGNYHNLSVGSIIIYKSSREGKPHDYAGIILEVLDEDKALIKAKIFAEYDFVVQLSAVEYQLKHF